MKNVGEEVNITEFYRQVYPLWKTEGKGKILEIFNKVAKLPMEKNALNMYVAKYGKLEEFPFISYLIDLDNKQYLVSEFGFQ